MEKESMQLNKMLIQAPNAVNKMSVGIPNVSGGGKCCHDDPVSFQGKRGSKVVHHCLIVDLPNGLPSKYEPGPTLFSL